MNWTATLSAEGTLEIPDVVQKKLGVQPGSTLVLSEHQDGRIEIKPQDDLLRWYGAQPVDGPQDWDRVRRETNLARAREIALEDKSD